MVLAALRPDGWPQATMVGYVSDGLVLYFAISRASQKLANRPATARVSIAIGHHGVWRGRSARPVAGGHGQRRH